MLINTGSQENFPQTGIQGRRAKNYSSLFFSIFLLWAPQVELPLHPPHPPALTSFVENIRLRWITIYKADKNRMMDKMMPSQGFSLFIRPNVQLSGCHKPDTTQKSWKKPQKSRPISSHRFLDEWSRWLPNRGYTIKRTP